jgi:hypothetical protein
MRQPYLGKLEWLEDDKKTQKDRSERATKKPAAAAKKPKEKKE